MIAFEPVATLGEAQELRVLRNECRGFMTGSVAEVSGAQQEVFFAEQVTTGRVHAWLLRRGGRADAYALLWPTLAGLRMSCGVAAAQRGQGAGTLVVAMVTAAGHCLGGPVWLEVWRDNAAARHVYLRAGYVITGTGTRRGRVVETMVHK